MEYNYYVNKWGEEVADLMSIYYATLNTEEKKRCNGCQTGHPSQKQHDCFKIDYLELHKDTMEALSSDPRVSPEQLVLIQKHLDERENERIDTEEEDTEDEEEEEEPKPRSYLLTSSDEEEEGEIQDPHNTPIKTEDKKMRSEVKELWDFHYWETQLYLRLLESTFFNPISVIHDVETRRDFIRSFHEIRFADVQERMAILYANPEATLTDAIQWPVKEETINMAVLGPLTKRLQSLAERIKERLPDHYSRFMPELMKSQASFYYSTWIPSVNKEKECLRKMLKVHAHVLVGMKRLQPVVDEMMRTLSQDCPTDCFYFSLSDTTFASITQERLSSLGFKML